MSRIVYIVVHTQEPTGGHKMAIRHVETLNDLGFDAVIHTGTKTPTPTWLAHRAEFRRGESLRDDDVLVIPEDATPALRHFAASSYRKVVFCQNHFFAAANGIGQLSAAEAAGYDQVIACSGGVAGWVRKYLAHASVDIVPAFADERIFRPAQAKQPMVVCTPRKRAFEERAIKHAFRHLYKGRSALRWIALDGASEAEVARAFGQASLFLSLSRFEGLGMTTLEAMASGCVVAGFTGIGGREYATPANGFWVGEDDCEAAAQALAAAAALVERGGPGLALMTEASRETAARWSRAAFVTALEAFWAARVARR